MTAPGAAKTNPKKLIATAKINIPLKALNSAKQRYLCATNLCPNSCNKNPSPTVNPETINIVVNTEEKTSPFDNIIAKAKDIATHAFNKCSISIWLNFILQNKVKCFIKVTYYT